ncbi:MAG TPA: hypothetical protein VNZ01_01240 [Solirubrobacteraceae bacterium]|nr:hypothetical protein [Solirubrobacteraceae bacterium]
MSWRYSDLARRIFTTKAKAKAIVHEAQTIGLLEMLDEARDGRFELRMLRFAEWHGKDPGAAARQRSSRASRGL